MVAVDTSRSGHASACSREPIHMPGAIQPHGFLIAVDEDSLRVTHASANVEQFLHLAPDQILGHSIEELFGESLVCSLKEAKADPLYESKAIHLSRTDLGGSAKGKALDLVAHQRDGLIVLEGETAPPETDRSLLELHARFGPVFDQMERATKVEALCKLVASEIRRLIGFDRVLIYQFDSDWNGRVVAEDRNDCLPSYLDLRFPEQDIPAQARELYRMTRLRFIANCDYNPVPILTRTRGGVTNASIDLSLSSLRSVSPVHLQYMRHMGTATSMSVSILRDEKLWGLISCHHHEPRHVSFARRSACELLGHVFSLQLAAREQNEHFALRMRRQASLATLLAKMTADVHFVEALGVHHEDLLALVDARGFAILHENRCILRGETPSEGHVRAIGEWLSEKSDWEFFTTHRLPQEFPLAETFKDVACGLLAVSISRVHMTYVLWFRPELIETVTWGGDPRKPSTGAGGSPTKLSPRASFEAWKQVVRGQSIEWQPEEIEVANEFRQAIVGVVLKRAEEIASLAEGLTKANAELAAFSYAVSHDLRAPFRHIRSYAEILRDEKATQLDEEANSMLDRILDASLYAGKLVDNLLAFAQMGRTAMKLQPVNMSDIVENLREQLMHLAAGRTVEWTISTLPIVQADVILIRQVWQNLLENALKYSRTRDVTRLEISAQTVGESVVFSVKDNGVGFDPRYSDKLFGVFQRLHRTEDFEGTGIGLANVRRIVERHGGKAWGTGRIGEGATFSFSLPLTAPTPEHA